MSPFPAGRYRVSAIVSAFKSTRFLPGLFEDLLSQTLYARGELEIVVVNTGSPEGDDALVRAYQARHPHVRYLHTPDRQPLYVAWNLAVRAATAPYVTSANTDDRHRFDALEVLADALDADPGAVLTYADVLYSCVENDTFEHTRARARWVWPEFSYANLRAHCCVGPQPMWRRSVHARYGWFDERLAVAGDWDFWLRLARHERFIKVDDALGIYYSNPEGLENAHPAASGEADLVRRRHGIRAEERAGRTTCTDCDPRALLLGAMRARRGASRSLAPRRPAVSAIVHGAGRQDQLRETLAGLQLQSWSDWELLVVTDRSEGVAIAREFAAALPDRSIRVLGASGARRADALNAGCAAARGSYLLPLEAGDLLDPDFMARLIDVIGRHTRFAFAFSDALTFGQRSEMVSTAPFDLQKLAGADPGPCPGLLRHEVWSLCGGFDARLDGPHLLWDCWLSSRKRGFGGAHLAQPLYYRRVGEAGAEAWRSAEQELRSMLLSKHPEVFEPPRAGPPRVAPRRAARAGPSSAAG